MRLWVDFNEIEGNGQIEADLDFAQFFLDTDLAVGNRADLFDGGGHQCSGTVLDVDLGKRLLKLQINWETWESSRRPRVFVPTTVPAVASFWDFVKTGMGTDETWTFPTSA